MPGLVERVGPALPVLGEVRLFASTSDPNVCWPGAWSVGEEEEVAACRPRQRPRVSWFSGACWEASYSAAG